jgi:ribosomal protein L16
VDEAARLRAETSDTPIEFSAEVLAVPAIAQRERQAYQARKQALDDQLAAMKAKQAADAKRAEAERAREIEAARRAMTRYVKRGGQVWIRVFPDVPITKKPLEVRMGSGKGNVEYYVARVQPGKVLFEMEGVTEAIAREAFRLAASKLSVDTLFVKRQVR